MTVNSIRHGGKSLDATLDYVDSRREAYPELTGVFDLYAAIFAIQSRFYDGFAPKSTEGPPDADSGSPALAGTVPGLKLTDVQQALVEISKAITTVAPERQAELESLSSLQGYARDDAAGLLNAPVGPGGAGPSVTRTIFLLALSPFYEKAAAGIVPSLAGMDWRFGHCPICGERSSIAKYELSSGAKLLQCGLCRTQWVRERLACAFCDNRDQDKLGYLGESPDSAFRVEICDACRHYIKAVDERALEREVILHVEELTMASFDREALAQGYQS